VTGSLIFYPESTGVPCGDLALEEDLLARAAGGDASLFLYAWSRPALVLGYAQEAASVDLAACARLGVPVLRRITGGTGVLHDHALSMALALPGEHPWCASIAALYDGFVESVREAVASAGVALDRGRGHGAPPGRRSPICFEDTLTESLLVEGRKVLGCAQARRKGACLVHGTLLFGLDADLQAAVYGVPRERVLGALGVVPPPAEALALVPLLARALAGGAGLTLGPASPAPAPSASSRDRYATSRWAPLGID